MSAGPARGIAALLALEHADPHSLLGAHPERGGVRVRAWRPDAAAVTLLPDGARRPVAMRRIEEAGLFEAFVARRKGPFPYRLEVRDAGGSTSTQRDPYSFPPTLGELDLHLLGEGRHEDAYRKLGAHVVELEGTRGVAFAVWAPNARGVSVVGDWNGWDGRMHPMRRLDDSGIWELFVPGLEPGARYKFELRTRDGPFLKADPYGSAMEPPPATASVVHERRFEFGDGDWMRARAAADPRRRPLSIYEVHLGSWRRAPQPDGRPLTYAELARELGEHVLAHGFTHVELLPVMEHPFSGSWGYQVGGYFAPTARFGDPDQFRAFVDALHRLGIGVLLDWVPAHFPKDAFALGRFDGTALYEHLDPRLGEHRGWGTYVFNYGRPQVRNFLIANALHWLDEFHADGLRVDAVASMLYLDYGRAPGEWVANRHGGRENLEAVEFLRELNETVHRRHPGALMIAEESTSWPGVTRPVHLGGLGFDLKWNMGWMHDTLHYFATDPLYRRWHHKDLTFGLLYAWSERFVLPLSHDEVVHLKRSLIGRMPGDRWRQFANLRALYALQWAHPGGKLLFMGGEFGQRSEWNHDQGLDWRLLEEEEHRGVARLVADLNRLYLGEPALHEADSEPEGFRWIDCDNADDDVIVFRRIAPASGREVACVGNFAPVARRDYRIGLPRPGRWREILNSDAAEYGGSGAGNLGAVDAAAEPCHGLPCSARLTLPPLAVLWFEAPAPSADRPQAGADGSGSPAEDAARR